MVEREGQVVVLELSVAEAHALRNWLLQPLSDGSTALDDPPVKASVAKLGAELDFVEHVSAVRTELEDSGLPTHGLSDTRSPNWGAASRGPRHSDCGSAEPATAASPRRVLLLRGLEVRIRSARVVGHVDHIEDLRHRVLERHLDALAQGDRGHATALAPTAEP